MPSEAYPKVKAFYDDFPKRSKQQIILKKIKPWRQEVGDFLRNTRARKEAIPKD